ncbi:MAG: hypothetical protein AAGI69_25110 [Cyanobacteria bacterium P01_H01_bin.21]
MERLKNGLIGALISLKYMVWLRPQQFDSFIKDLRKTAFLVRELKLVSELSWAIVMNRLVSFGYFLQATLF